MISRYKVFGQPAITLVQSNTLSSSTANTATYTVVIQGPKSCVVGLKVTLFSSFGSSPQMSINSTFYVLNDTFSVTLDAVTGLATLTQFLSISNTSGHTISVQVTIETVSKGIIKYVDYYWDNTVRVP
jgi:hypothetical protein